MNCFLAPGSDCTFDYTTYITTVNIKINKVSHLPRDLVAPACRKLHSHSLTGPDFQTFHHCSKAALSNNFQELIGDFEGASSSRFSRCHFSLRLLKHNRYKEDKGEVTFIPFPIYILLPSSGFYPATN